MKNYKSQHSVHLPLGILQHFQTFFLLNFTISQAEAYGIPYKVDIYPHYGSDATAYWHAGGLAAAALIGPGVDSSHHYERTHHDALLATTQWVLAYLLAD